MRTDTKVIIGIVLATVIILAGGIWWAQRLSGRQLGPAVGDQSVLLRDDRPTLGLPTAKVTIVEFADFQCPACRTAYPILQSLLEAYPQQTRLIFRHFPLIENHANALPAARAAEAARQQGKFWEMYDRLFATQAEWSGLDAAAATDFFYQQAAMIGLDGERFKQASGDDSLAARIAADRADGEQLGVRGTPTLYIGGQEYTGTIAFEALKNVILELDRSR